MTDSPLDRLAVIICDNLNITTDSQPMAYCDDIVEGMAEAGLVVIDAPPLRLGIDTEDETDRIMRRVVGRRTARFTDEVGEQARQALREGPWFRQELARRVEVIDRTLAGMGDWLAECRSDLRDGALPDMADHSGWDQKMRELRQATAFIDGVIDGATGLAYERHHRPEGGSDA